MILYIYIYIGIMTNIFQSKKNPQKTKKFYCNLRKDIDRPYNKAWSPLELICPTIDQHQRIRHPDEIHYIVVTWLKPWQIASAGQCQPPYRVLT